MDPSRAAEVPRVIAVGGPPVHFSRPAVDVLVRSVAEVFGSGAVAVVLSGAGTDGGVGALTVKTTCSGEAAR